MFKVIGIHLIALACLPAAADWQYQNQTDPMTSKETRYAQIESNASLTLDFPYSGRNYSFITVRQHPRTGLAVIFNVQKGQLMCRSYDDKCGLYIRFDDAPAIRFRGSPSGDGDPKYIFLNDTRGFVARAEKAKRILVQASVYQHGNQVIEFFSSDPLSWTPKRSVGRVEKKP